jgi:flagellar hook protein FlgE
MSISAALSISTQGMQDHARRLAQYAGTIATGSVSSGDALAVGKTDAGLASEMLDVITAEQGFAANASVFETGADMWDVLATIVRD